MEGVGGGEVREVCSIAILMFVSGA
jgi:hypothetical protein